MVGIRSTLRKLINTQVCMHYRGDRLYMHYRASTHCLIANQTIVWRLSRNEPTTKTMDHLHTWMTWYMYMYLYDIGSLSWYELVHNLTFVMTLRKSDILATTVDAVPMTLGMLVLPQNARMPSEKIRRRILKDKSSRKKQKNILTLSLCFYTATYRSFLSFCDRDGRQRSIPSGPFWQIE